MRVWNTGRFCRLQTVCASCGSSRRRGHFLDDSVAGTDDDGGSDRVVSSFANTITSSNWVKTVSMKGSVVQGSFIMMRLASNSAEVIVPTRYGP
jgi:hypothetical protein